MRLDSWSVDHALQPPDTIEIPALAEHLLVFSARTKNKPTTRQISRFLEQEYDGPGYHNQFFIVPAGVPSEFIWNGHDEAIAFGLTPQSLYQTALQAECINPNNIELKPILIAEDEQIVRIAYSLLHEIYAGGEGGRLYSESLLTCLNIHLLRHYCTFQAKLKGYQQGLSKRKLKRAIDYIQAHLTEEIRLNDIAQRLNMGSYYFSRLFQRSTGLPPYQYVLRERVELAKRRLRDSEDSISDIALDCGFSSSSQLSRHFRKFVGTTASQYRQQ